ncbi:hypothetical protein BTE77_27880 [Ensifer adhaerens]|nr:hypothetical protein BTE77_27880 [Ensifer adhaerens]
MQTSEKGIAFLRTKENTVLKAYRDVAGVWTIGDGLTAKSGVITPKAGMTITMVEATRLLKLALARNYEPRVARALGPSSQNAFDGAVSFDFNTGAISRASWVNLFLEHKIELARAALLSWNKAGGKALPGLTRRRQEEADIIFRNRYPQSVRVGPAKVGDAEPRNVFAVFVITVEPADVERIRSAFRGAGYDPGGDAGKVLLKTVRAFQVQYGLTPDGKIGKATLSTLQRVADAKAKGKATAVATIGSGALAGGNAAATPLGFDVAGALADPALITLVIAGMAAIAGCRLAWLAWHYRDTIAPRLKRRLPRFAAWLGRF